MFLKFRLRGAVFAKHPPSNNLGNPRRQAFGELVDEVLALAGAHREGVRLLQVAANVGMIAVEAPAVAVRQLVEHAALEAAYLTPQPQPERR